MKSAGTVRLPPAHCTCSRVESTRDRRGARNSAAIAGSLKQSVTSCGRCARGSAEPYATTASCKAPLPLFYRFRDRRALRSIDVRLLRALGNLSPLSFAITQAHLLLADHARE